MSADALALTVEMLAFFNPLKPEKMVSMGAEVGMALTVGMVALVGTFKFFMLLTAPKSLSNHGNRYST